MSKVETRLWRLFFELEKEITKMEEKNIILKEKINQTQQREMLILPPSPERKEWVELEPGKRFLTKKELAKYLGMGVGTISNKLSNGTFPIRAKRVGRSVRFDMREVLEYLETNKQFWERDRERKLGK